MKLSGVNSAAALCVEETVPQWRLPLVAQNRFYRDLIHLRAASQAQC